MSSCLFASWTSAAPRRPTTPPAAPGRPGRRRARRRGRHPGRGARRGRRRRHPGHGHLRPGRRLRRPAGPARGDRGGPAPTSTRRSWALELAFDRIVAYHAARGHAAGRLRRRRCHRQPPDPPGRARRHLRARWPGPLPLDRPHVRRTGPGGRRPAASPCACRPGPDGQDRRRHPVRRVGGRDRRGVPDRRRPGHRRHGLRHRQRPGRRRHRRPGQRLRGRGQAPGLGRGRRGLGLRRALRDRRGRRPGRAPRPSPPSTWSSRPSTAPTAWPGWSPGTPTCSSGSSPRSDPIVAASSRRADLEATLATAGIACLVDGPDEAMAVANAVAPEHLQLMVPDDEGDALLEQVQNAGAVFIGDWSPASMGDYIAGPNHVLPTNRTARFASALRADDFRKHIHAVRVTPEALRTLGPQRGHAGRDGGPARPRRFRAPPPGRARRRPADASPHERGPPGASRPPAGGGLPLAPGRGRGAPQHQRVAVRPARRLARGAAGGARGGLVPPLPRPPGHRAAPAVADLHGVSPDEVFCANGSNEVLQCLLLAFGGPGRRALLFEPTYALHSHIARITGTAVVEGDAQRRLPDRPGRRRAAHRGRAARHHLPVLAQQPDRPGRAPRDRRRRARTPPPAWSSSTRPTGSSRRGRALELRGPDHPGLVVTRTFSKTWAMAGARLGYLVADPAVVQACEAVVLPVPPVGPDPAGRPPGPAPRPRDGGPGGPHRRGAGPGGRRPGRPAGRQLAVGRQLHPVPAPRPRRRRRLAVPPRPLRAHPQLRQLGRPAGCLRVTIGTPEENDRFLHALKESL